MSSKVVPGYVPPIITMSADSMNVRIPKQATTAKTGEVIFWTGLGLAVLGGVIWAGSKL